MTRWIIIGLTLWRLLPQGVQAETFFDAPSPVGGGNYFCCADMNGDGDQDVVAIGIWMYRFNVTGSSLFWHENLGHGTFKRHDVVSSATISVGYVQPVDLDVDGDMDLAAFATPKGGSGQLGWFENNGLHWAGFTYHKILNTGSSSQLVVCDLNRDRRPDLLYTRPVDANHAALVWAENGADTPLQFTTHSLAITSKYSIPAVADLDGDGRQDVLESIRQDGTYWYHNEGGWPPTFTRNLVTSAASGPLRTADFNGDGRLDVMIGFSWAENNGGSPLTFTHHFMNPDAPVPAYGYTGTYAVGDIDGDKDPDVLGLTETASVPHGLYWMENDGASLPRFKLHAAWPKDSLYISDLCDINGDGKLDAVLNDDTSWGAMVINPYEVKWMNNVRENAIGGKIWKRYE